MRLMRQAAAQGHREALFSLGVMYAEGRGTARKLPVAFALVDAVPSPDASTAEYRDTLLAHMTPVQRDQARRLAGELRASGVNEETILRIAER